ncbi:MAG: hypothetical protein RIS70_3375 [Planctomycetota bacterium]|jgi:hypothetical protein
MQRIKTLTAEVTVFVDRTDRWSSTVVDGVCRLCLRAPGFLVRLAPHVGTGRTLRSRVLQLLACNRESERPWRAERRWQPDRILCCRPCKARMAC